MWKPIPGYEGLYEVNDDSRIKSLDRQIISSTGQTYMVKGKILTPTNAGRNYLSVLLYKNGKHKRVYVHIIVATVFVPNPNNLPTVNHKDGNKNHCQATNLEWSTYSANNQHAYDTGLHGKGERHYQSKLTERDVREIRANGKYTTYQRIADKYGVTKATIRDILINRIWKDIH